MSNIRFIKYIYIYIYKYLEIYNLKFFINSSMCVFFVGKLHLYTSGDVKFN